MSPSVDRTAEAAADKGLDTIVNYNFFMKHRQIALTSVVVLTCMAVIGGLGTFGPMAVMLPFQAQQNWWITLAHGVAGWGRWVSIGVAVMAVLAAVGIWRAGGWLARTLTVIAVLPAITFAVVSRVNLAEAYFAAAGRADLAMLNDYKEIDEKDMVIGVVIGGEARAYPVRYLAYHHMLNDQLGGRPILPNY